MVCLLAASWVQLSVSAGNGRPHNALWHHWLMPISCHFRDCKALLVTSLADSCYTSVQTPDLYLYICRPKVVLHLLSPRLPGVATLYTIVCKYRHLNRTDLHRYPSSRPLLPKPPVLLLQRLARLMVVMKPGPRWQHLVSLSSWNQNQHSQSRQRWFLHQVLLQHSLTFLSASLYFSKRGAY